MSGDIYLPEFEHPEILSSIQLTDVDFHKKVATAEVKGV